VRPVLLLICPKPPPTMIQARQTNASPSARTSNRVLFVENSRFFPQMVAEAIGERLALQVSIAGSLAEAARLIKSEGPFLLTLTGLVLPDADHEKIIEFFMSRQLPTVVVSGVFDEDVRQHILDRPVIDYVLKNAPGAVDYLVWLVQRLDRNREITALVVDDSPSARQNMGGLLAMYGFRVIEAGSGQEGLEAIARESSIRLVIADHQMPEMDGIEFTRRLRADHPRDRMSVIGVSGIGASSPVAQFLKNGANDFLHKPFSREEFFCRVSQNVDNLDLIGSLQDLATKDFLTGLSNRRHFFERGNQLFDQARSSARKLNVAMLDIDHFKKINDTWGHDAGDAALRAVANAVARFARPQDVVSRFGGEEFCIIAPDLRDTEAEFFFEGLRARIEALQIEFAGEAIPVTTSVGVCIGRRPSLDQMISEADRVLYLAKAGGRNRVEVSRIDVARET
jgi:diguanylate cyclase (GGDEF)-like protein